jgi:hypothetical protein
VRQRIAAAGTSRPAAQGGERAPALAPPAYGIGFLDDRRAPVQRVVDVNGEKDPAKLWAGVRGLVEKVYKRKKTLLEWSAKPANQLNKEYKKYQELADALDQANQSKASRGRKRPDWAPGIVTTFSKTWGGKRHRRHIVMSSLMRDAVYAVTDKAKDIDNQNEAEALKIYNSIIEVVGRQAKDDLDAAEEDLVYVLHNNPANLVLDSGDENSAIGALSHNVDKLLRMDDKELGGEFDLFKKDNGAYLALLAKGFNTEIQKAILSTIAKSFPMPSSLEEFRELLEMIYDNTALDVLTHQALPKQAPQLLDLHGRFLAVQNSGDLRMLEGVAITYVKVGLAVYGELYTKIW